MTENANRTKILRQLPSVDRLLKHDDMADLVQSYGREAVRDVLRVALNAGRQFVRQSGSAPSVEELLTAAASLLRIRQAPTLRPVINATGVIIHTNLGRVPLAEAAQHAIVTAAGNYSTLDYDLDDGSRGKRDRHVESLVTAITGAEAAMVVNNNAAAILLTLSALARGREVVISRGQLIEIGGGFRLPDMMAESGARLVEVGTTNCTRLDDFERAIGPQSALLIHIQPSNFKRVGFTEEPSLRELADLAHARDIYAVSDVGSGALIDTSKYGLAHEPTVQESVKSGADLVMFSADKLLGGPQAGIIAGRRDLVERLKRHSLARAVRIDKLCLAALIATLEIYRRGEAATAIPVWQMIAQPVTDLRARVEAWAMHVGGEVIQAESTVGGGSLPGETLPTFALALEVAHPDRFVERLRSQPTPVIARIAHDRVLLDPRTVLPGQDQALLQVLAAALGETLR